MPAPKTYKTEALVLKHIELGEADRILTLYTPNLGKLKTIVKGARKSKSKLAGHVQPLTHCSLMISRGRNLDIITQAQTLESFLSIRNDLWLTARALYIIELTDAFTAEHLENYGIYKLLLDSLHRLDSIRSVELLFRYFEIQLLGHAGYDPQLRECLNCKTSVEPIDNFFTASGGGIICPECAHTEPIIQPISVNALKVLRLLQRGDYTTASRLRLPSDLSLELKRTLKGYIRHLLERELRSTTFLDRLSREAVTVKLG